MLGQGNHRSLRVRHRVPAALASLVFGILVLASRNAMADDDAGDEPSPHVTDADKIWYSWQIMLADASVVAIGVGAGRLSETNQTAAIGLGATGTAVYVFGGPVIHLLQGQPGKAGISLGLRILCPLGLGGTFALLYSNNPWGSAAGGLVGAGVGVAGAAIADWIMAWKPKASAPEPSPQAVGLQWLPSVTAASDSRRQTIPIFGVGGTF